MEPTGAATSLNLNLASIPRSAMASTISSDGRDGEGSNASDGYSTDNCMPNIMTCDKRKLSSGSMLSTVSADSFVSQQSKRSRLGPATQRGGAGGKRKTDMTEGELQITRDLKQLTLNDKQKINNEVEGSEFDVVHETPELIATSLQAMSSELAKMRTKKGFDFALFVSPRRVKDPEFRLMFLRAEKFHIRKAAKRIIAFFDFKMDLFGAENITKDITLFDMTDDDREAMYAGGKQLLPHGKDETGRIIVWDCIKFRKYKNPKNHLRMFFYLLMKILENDVQAQTRGMVVVGYIIDCPTLDLFGMDVNEPLTVLTKALPVRFSAFHLCYDNPALNVLLSTILLAMPKEIRVRHRTHFGSHMEVQYDITTNYGIPKALVPVDQSGNIKPRRFHQWLDRLLEEESIAHAMSTLMPKQQDGTGTARPFWSDARHRAVTQQQHSNHKNHRGSHAETGTITLPSSSPSSLSYVKVEHISVPKLQDVLLGRGRPYREYPGNIMLRDIVHEVQRDYDKMNKNQKTALTTIILTKVKASGGRFLSRADNEDLGWVSVDDEVARTKVAQSFRNNRIGRDE
mmetsp:Transcript_5212/g.15226  ORF Transcript_5212/g.15226 Transcript_5212/m.15226 type:complete len:571 (+) Transcript_5212:512-2224(+)